MTIFLDNQHTHMRIEHRTPQRPQHAGSCTREGKNTSPQSTVRAQNTPRKVRVGHVMRPEIDPLPDRGLLAEHASISASSPPLRRPRPAFDVALGLGAVPVAPVSLLFFVFGVAELPSRARARGGDPPAALAWFGPTLPGLAEVRAWFSTIRSCDRAARMVV